jgi:flagellar export protein FliJ
MSEQAVQQELLIRKVEERRDSKMAEVLNAAKERKSLEQLLEKKRLEHRKELEHQEQNFLDDITSTRRNRVATAGG